MYTPATPELGIQPIALSSLTQNHPLGTQIDAYDPTFGAGRFIYLEGVVNTAVGSVVVYNPTAATTTLIPSTANLAQPIAIAMSANGASSFGWYQLSGVAVIKKTAVAVSPNVPLFISGTAGSVFPTATAGKQILDCRTVNTASVASGVGTINALIQYPFAQGQIT